MSKGPSSQTVTQKTEQPDYVTSAQQNSIDATNRITSPFLTTAPTTTVAGFTPDQTQGFNLTRDFANDVFANRSPSLAVSPTLGTSASQSIPYYQAQDPQWLGTSHYAAEVGNPAVHANATNTGPTALASVSGTGPAAIANPYTSAAASLSDPSLGQVTGNSISALLNPYTKDVLDPTLSTMRRQNDITKAGISAKDASSAAFGGSRGALQLSEADRGLGDQIAYTTGDLMSKGYDAATKTALANANAAQNAGQFNAGETNKTNQYNAGQLNTVGMYNAGSLNQNEQYNAGEANKIATYNAGQQNLNNQFNAGEANKASTYNAGADNFANQFNVGELNKAAAANALADNAMGQYNMTNRTGLDKFNVGAANDASLQGVNVATGDANRGLTQQSNDTLAREKAIAQLLSNGQLQQTTDQSVLNQPTDMLKLLQSMTPNVASPTVSTTVPTTSNPLGTASGVLGLGQGLFGSSGLFPGALSAGVAALSDERDKTDIEKLGTDPKTGVDMYAYRYKGDPKNTPKVVGPMAQDMQKKYPGSVREIGGHKVVDGSALRAIFGMPA
jgi:hypothetical protein